MELTMSTKENIEQKIRKIPPEMLAELEHYLDYLIAKTTNEKENSLSFSWAAGLEDVNESSVELQKKALDWR
jgi:hypothetical protein